MAFAALQRLLAGAGLALALLAAADAAELPDELRANAPVTPGSAAWDAVMDSPLRDGDSLSHASADLMTRWRRPEVAAGLRRALLLAHLRMASGELPLPAPEATVRSLWRPGMPMPSLDELQLALRKALGSGLSLSPGGPPELPPQMFPVAVPGIPGFFRVNGSTRVFVSASVRSTAALILAFGRMNAEVTWAGQSTPVTLECALRVTKPGLAPRESGAMLCTSDDPLPRVERWPDRWQWQPPLLMSDAGLDALAKALANPGSMQYVNLATSLASCTDQGNCGDEQLQAQAQRAQARAARAAAEQTAREAEQKAFYMREARSKRLNGLMVIVALILGQIVFVALARTTGSLLPPRLLVMGGSVVVSVWLARAARDTGSETIAPLILAAVAVGALGAGAMLCWLYGAVYRRFFAAR